MIRSFNKSKKQGTVHRLINDDRSVFEEIFNNHYKGLLRFTLEYIPREEDAKDIVQNSFIKLWENRKDLREETNLKSYLIVITKNKCISYLRHLKIKDDYLKKEMNKRNVYFNLSLIALENFEYDQLINKEFEEILNDAINALPEKCKNVFSLSRFSGLKNQEISKKLNISHRTVENHISKALKCINERINKYLEAG